MFTTELIMINRTDAQQASSIKIGCNAFQWLDNVDMHRYAKFDQTIPCGSIVGNPNRKKMHFFGFVGIFEYIC